MFRRKISISTTILAAAVMMAMMAADLQADVLYHRYEEGTPPNAATTIDDSSGNGLDGAAGGTHAPSFDSAQPISPIPQNSLINDQSLDFERNSPTDGAFTDADYYTVADTGSALSFDSTTSFTIEAWVKLETVAPQSGALASDRVPLVMKKTTGGAGDTTANYIFYVNTGAVAGSPDGRRLLLHFGTGAALQSVLAPSLIVGDTDWHHVSLAVDQSTNSVRFGVDGIFETVSGVSALDSITTNSDELVVGAHVNGSGNVDGAFDGLVDELRIHDSFVAQEGLLNVPEPASLALLALGGLALARRRRGV